MPETRGWTGRSARAVPGRAGSGAPGRRAGRGADRPGLPRLDDPSRDPPAESLLPEFIDQIGQFLGREAVDQVGRGGASGIGVEAHVERPVGGEAEPPAFPGELVRRKAQVQQHTIHAIDPQFLQHPAHLGISRVDECHRQVADRLPGQFQHRRVAVQPDDPPGRPTRPASATAWPPPPVVPSRRSEPSPGASQASTSSSRTG